MISSHLFALTSQGMFLSNETCLQLFTEGWIVDGRAGGLVVGRSHLEGNIYMIRQCKGGFEFASHLQGGEYIMTHKAVVKFETRLKAINDDPGGNARGGRIETIPYGLRTFHTAATPFDKLLLIDARDQFIVNRESTARFLSELVAMNEAENDFLNCNLGELASRQLPG